MPNYFIKTVGSSCVKILALAVLLTVAGCQTAPVKEPTSGQAAAKPQSIVLEEGDVVRITFPGADNLNTVQGIRRDGMISLPQVGEFKAAGITPGEMEKQLVEKYGPLLVTKEVNVTVESSAYPIYVSGAVLRPGKTMYDRPMTALEAVMEAGIDYAKANLKAVTVIRQEKGQTQHYKLNLQEAIDGKQIKSFVLSPSDIIYVPNRFNWF